ncbi:hypothetical protein UFOVP204_159 [uncultured Caudovirales phage]|uniref:Uncharacterized protein n=1 Tax=uncultured Caudovirales phage TaxID=2100421 RepID=A0A6J7WKP5_9CAUD|nr:hypothetical protein UFOVP204_159 [uncultured Caudovirales phage]
MSPRHQTKRIFGPYFASDTHWASGDIKKQDPATQLEKKIEDFFKTLIHYITLKRIKK